MTNACTQAQGQAEGQGPKAKGRAFAAVVVFLGAALGVTAPAGAQERAEDGTAAPAQVRPLAPATRIGFRAYGHYELVSMTASKTFDAVLGKARMQGPGGGGEVLGIWKGLFVRGAVSQMKETGTRAFVFSGDVIPVNIPLSVKIRTVELGGGWRVQPRQAPRLAVYAGGGALLLKYDETSDLAQPGENASESFNGYIVFGGAEFTLWKWIVAGIEGQYRAVPDALGGAGTIPELFNEDDLGGVAVRVLFGIRR